jgi:Domain of unknown function (DUF4381)
VIDSLTAYKDTLIFNPKLGELKPIFIPEPIQFEPVTLGWYIVLAVVVIIILFVIYKLFKKYQSKAYRRSSAKELLKLKIEVGNSRSSEIIRKISTILKATALVSYTRDKVAKLSGDEWESFLVNSYSAGSKFKAAFALLSYQYIPEDDKQSFTSADIEKLIDASVKWVRSHRV